MGRLYLLRHGQSQWNLEDRFTGWVDVPLTEEGRREMVAAGEKMRGTSLARVYTSALNRTRESARIVLDTCGQQTVPVSSVTELNERFYGDLQGLNKSETAERYGAEQVNLWRRSYSIKPPGGESLEDAAARILPFFEQTIWPQAASCENILVCAHGNTLRAIRMRLDHLSREEVTHLEIPTGGLYLYEIESGGDVLGEREISFP